MRAWPGSSCSLRSIARREASRYRSTAATTSCSRRGNSPPSDHSVSATRPPLAKRKRGRWPLLPRRRLSARIDAPACAPASAGSPCRRPRRMSASATDANGDGARVAVEGRQDDRAGVGQLAARQLVALAQRQVDARGLSARHDLLTVADDGARQYRVPSRASTLLPSSMETMGVGWMGPSSRGCEPSGRGPPKRCSPALRPAHLRGRGDGGGGDDARPLLQAGLPTPARPGRRARPGWADRRLPRRRRTRRRWPPGLREGPPRP